MSKLISPPYDVISEAGLRDLRTRHPLNSVQLALVDNPDDPERYKKLGARFQHWKKDGVLAQEQTPGFFLIEEKFQAQGKAQTRLGFVGLLEITPFDQRQVLPHEYTLAGPKKDRFELLREMGAELSQVFFCYKDSSLILEKLYKRAAELPLLFEIPETDGVARRVWKIENPSDVSSLQALLATQPVLIADGHHRYETSIHFRGHDATPRSQFVQGYFMNLDSPGFSIEPIHRIFSLPETLSWSDFLKKVKAEFEVTPATTLSLESLVAQKSQSKKIEIYLMSESGELLRLSKKPRDEEDCEIFALHRDVFEGILNWDVSSLQKGVIRYEHDTQDFLKTLQSTPRGVGIFLPPTDLNIVMKRAERGERMPQKSTYFFPKIATGLLVYELGSL